MISVSIKSYLLNAMNVAGASAYGIYFDPSAFMLRERPTEALHGANEEQGFESDAPRRIMDVERETIGRHDQK
jgi:hypothetical protein